MGVKVRQPNMPPQNKSKEAKAIAAANASKGKKKKWKSTKSNEKASSLCLLPEETYKKVLTEVPNYKIISTCILADRFNVNGSLARAIINDLVLKNLIRPVISHNNQCIFTKIDHENSSKLGSKAMKAPKSSDFDNIDTM